LNDLAASLFRRISAANPPVFDSFSAGYCGLKHRVSLTFSTPFAHYFVLDFMQNSHVGFHQYFRRF